MTGPEPLDYSDPNDYEQGPQKSRYARWLHGDAEQAEMVYHHGRDNLSGQEQAYRRRRPEAGRQDDRGAHEESPEQTAEPHPPGRVHDGPQLGHGATDDSCGRKQDNGPNEKRERGRQYGAADDLAQLAVDGELRGRGHPCGERHG